MITEWRVKADDLSAELNTSQTEMRNYSSEIFRMKAEWEDVKFSTVAYRLAKQSVLRNPNGFLYYDTFCLVSFA